MLQNGHWADTIGSLLDSVLMRVQKLSQICDLSNPPKNKKESEKDLRLQRFSLISFPNCSSSWFPGYILMTSSLTLRTNPYFLKLNVSWTCYITKTHRGIWAPLLFPSLLLFNTEASMQKTAGCTKKPQGTTIIRGWAQFHRTHFERCHTISVQKYLRSQIEQQNFADLI